jgi:hypothetical protein
MSRGIEIDALSVPIEAGLRIVLSIEKANESFESFEISKHGVLIPLQDQILESKKLVPHPLVTDKISISKIKASKLYAISIELPAKQRIFVSKELKDCSVSIHVFRQFVDAWHPTNLALLVISSSGNVLYQDKRFLSGVTEQPNEVVAKEASPKQEKIEIEEASLPQEVIEVIKEESNVVVTDPVRPKFNFKGVARGVAFALALIVALIVVTPLSLVHPNKLENQMSSVYLVWPTKNPSVGSEVLGFDENQLIYAAEVHSNEGGIILLKIDEYYIQTELDQIMGKAVIQIPLLGKLIS